MAVSASSLLGTLNVAKRVKRTKTKFRGALHFVKPPIPLVPLLDRQSSKEPNVDKPTTKT